MKVLSQAHYEVWTSDQKLFGHLIAEPGIAAQFKHRDQTTDTKRALEEVEDIMRDLYELAPAEIKPPLPKWRNTYIAN